jgi:hypothetical protein
MTPLEWFSVGVGVVSVLGVWLTGIAWWHGRATNKLISSTAEGTQALITTTTTNTQAILERMDQQANQRQREMMEAIQALKR